MLGISGINTGSSFINPLSISGIKFWVDSETSMTAITNGPINSIGDQSGNGNLIRNIAGTGTRPVWADVNTGVPNITFKNNLKHGIFLESGGDWLTFDGTTSSPYQFLPNATTVFIVSKHTDTTNTSAFPPISAPLTILCGSNSSTWLQVGYSAGTAVYVYPSDPGSNWRTFSSTRTNLNDGVAHSVCWTHIGTTITCYIDGVLDSVQTAATTYDTVHSGFNSIGAYGQSGGFTGGISEIMVFNNSLDASTVASLHSRAKYLWI